MTLKNVKRVSEKEILYQNKNVLFLKRLPFCRTNDMNIESKPPLSQNFEPKRNLEKCIGKKQQRSFYKCRFCKCHFSV